MRRVYMVELERSFSNSDISDNEDFKCNFKAAILMSLLNDKAITKWQFDQCLEQIKRGIPHAGHSTTEKA